MSLFLVATGNQKKDIENIITQTNLSVNDDDIQNALNIVAYGKLDITVPVSDPFQTFTASFTHNLGYAPMFIANLVSETSTEYRLPILLATYGYVSGPKSQGSYPVTIINAWCDTQTLTIALTNVTNLSGFLAGVFFFSYYIFSQPINS